MQQPLASHSKAIPHVSDCLTQQSHPARLRHSCRVFLRPAADALRFPPWAAQLMRHATPLFDPIQYKGATNKRRFYEEVQLPRNLVVLGDAVCTFNP